MSREQTQWEEVRAFPECLQAGGNGRSAAVGCRVWYSVGRVKIPVWLLIWIYDCDSQEVFKHTPLWWIIELKVQVKMFYSELT